MSLLAHVVDHDETLIEKVLHPLTGLDHIIAIALVSISLALVLVAMRGRRAATTSGAVTRVRSIAFIAVSSVLLAASSVLLIVV